MCANQLRLTLQSVEYVLLASLRRLGLAGTARATAQSTLSAGRCSRSLREIA
jgi:hypothetical protein